MPAQTVHMGDFRAQLWRTYRNITALLESEGATWHDIVRTTCYLRDIERDYKDFNEVRTAFFDWLGLDPLPASTGIQARLCREDLLVEIEAIAVGAGRGGAPVSIEIRRRAAGAAARRSPARARSSALAAWRSADRGRGVRGPVRGRKRGRRSCRRRGR